MIFIPELFNDELISKTRLINPAVDDKQLIETELRCYINTFENQSRLLDVCGKIDLDDEAFR